MKTLTKNLITLQDLLLGTGTAKQQRNGTLYTVSKILLPRFITSETELASIDFNLFPFVLYWNYDTAIVKLLKYDSDTETWKPYVTEAAQDVIAEIQADVLALQNTVGSHTTAISALNTGLSDLEAIVTAMATDLTAAQTDITTLETTVASLALDVAALGAPMEVMLRLTSDKSVTGSFAALNWDSAVYQDNVTLWDISSPSRITIPNGVSRIKILMHGLIVKQFSNASKYWARIDKNGATTFYPGKAAIAVPPAYYVYDYNHDFDMESGWIDVTPGDYFQVLHKKDGTTVTFKAESADNTTGSWIQILAKP